MSTPTDDRAAVGQVIRALKAAGYKLLHVDNGEENVKVTTATEAIEAIFEVDQAWLLVLDPDTGAQGCVFFVLGNDPEEVVCDHTINLSDTLDPLLDSWIY
jgi:predicted fused transcriptional regulator/phosphomethylpyrimidine kinase